jgi:hypothetical protein
MPRDDGRVRIALIDSGINQNVSDLAEFVHFSGSCRCDMEGRIIEDGETGVGNEHGTAIALIIRSLCRNVEFVSMNILNDNLAADCRVLLYAIHRSLSHSPDIVHLSLGTRKWKYILPLKKIIRIAADKGAIVVSAADNEGRVSYPAGLKGVFGVKTGDYPPGAYGYDGKYFLACGSAEKIPGADRLTDRPLTGSSMSAAYVTGHVSRLIRSGVANTYQSLKKELLEKLKDCKSIEEDWV